MPANAAIAAFQGGTGVCCDKWDINFALFSYIKNKKYKKLLLHILPFYFFFNFVRTDIENFLSHLSQRPANVQIAAFACDKT